MCVSRRIERDASASAARFFFKVMRSVFATIVTDHAIVAVRVIEVVFVRVVYRVHAFEHVPGTTPDRPSATARLPLPHALCARIPFFNHKRTHTLSTRDSGSCRARLMRA